MTMLSAAEIEDWKKRHLPYRLQMLDGLRWWCEFKQSGKDHQAIALTVNAQQVCASMLTNGITESGLMAGRFLLEFLGLQPRKDDNSPTGFDIITIPDKKRNPNDVWAQRIGCVSVSPHDLTLNDRRVCGYAHKRASQGVGHPTRGPEGAELTWLVAAANTIERTITDRVYFGDAPLIRSHLWLVASPD